MVSMEYRMDVKAKSFWITTFLIPVMIVAFGVFIAFLSEGNAGFEMFSKSTAPTPDDINDDQAIGMICGVFLTMFVMMYGAQIFNKVRTEKTNRIVEVLVSSVSGRSVMLSKVISVALIGLTQMLVWALLIMGIVFAVLVLLPVKVSFSDIFSVSALWPLVVCLLYFIGGFVFYGALYAAAGAMTDRNNENSGYLSVLMMLMMASMYIGIYAVDADPGAPFAVVCFYLPFTSSTVGAVQTVAGMVPWWQTLISLVVLFVTDYIVLSLAGKIYTSAVLLKGKKLTPKDILTFLKSK